MQGILIVGPTGVGKTALSLRLAQTLHCPIISCDSMQVYKSLDIGTAKATLEEQKAVKHYMIDCADITDKFDVGQYYDQVSNLLNTLSKTEDFVVVVGGTGLYAKAIDEGLSNLPSENIAFRESLNRLSLSELQDKLKKDDPSSFEAIDCQNPIRVIRALEVFHLTGQSFITQSRKNVKKHTVEFHKYALTRSREALYQRINQRVLDMIDQGLILEAQQLFVSKKEAVTALQAIGYKELFDYFEKKISLEDAIETIQKNSRHYAKRQITWYKKIPNIHWLNMDEMIVEEAKALILSDLNIKKN